MRNRMLLLCGLLVSIAATPIFAQEGPPKPVVTLGTPDTRWKAELYSVALSRDGSTLMFASSQEELTLVDTKTNKVIRTIAIRKDEPLYLPKFTNDGTGIYIIKNNKYTLYDVKTGKNVANISLPTAKNSGPSGIFGPKNRYFPSYDGKKLAVSVENERNQPVRIWDVQTDKSLGEIKPNQNNDAHYCCWSADGSILSISGYRHDKKDPKDEATNEYVDFYDGKTLKPQGRIHAGERAWVILHELSPDGKFLCLYCEGFVRFQLYDIAAKKRVIEMKMPPEDFRFGAFFFSPDSKKVGLQMETGGAYVWDTKSLELLGKKKVPDMIVGGIGFVSDKEILAAGTNQKDVVLFDLFKEEAKGANLAHTKTVFTTAFSKDGKYLYTGGLEQKIIRWDVSNGKPLDIVVHPPERIYSDWEPNHVAFSPNRDFFVAMLSSGVALANLNEKGGVFLSIKGKFYPRWQTMKISEDGKSIYAWGSAQEKTEFGNKLDSNAYACHWKIDGTIIKEGAGRINQNANEYFKAQFPDAKFAPSPSEDSSNPLVVFGKETIDPKDPKKKLIPITFKSRKEDKVLLELNLPLAHPNGISFSPDAKLVAIPLADHTIQIFKLP